MNDHPSPVAVTGGRDLGIDTLRIGAMMAVAVGHWLVTAVSFSGGFFAIDSPLAHLSGGWILTQFLQVVPLFFIVGGWAGANSYRRAEGRDTTAGSGGSWGWVKDRVVRLTTGTVAAAAVIVATGAVLALVFGLGTLVWPAVALALQPLWFLGVYIVVSATIPFAVTAADRLGLILPFVLLGTAAVLDIGGTLLPGGVGEVLSATAGLNVVLVWWSAHQLGVCWQSRPMGRWWVWILAGWAIMFLGWNAGWPLELVGVTGADRSNMNPPSIMIIAQVLVSVGAALALRPVLHRFATDHLRVRWALRGAGAVAVGVFTFHLVALLITAGVAALVTGLDGSVAGLTAPPVTTGWLLVRLTWFPVFIAVLGVLLTGLRRVLPLS
ncbi:MAG: acyltransferase family protein [Euzebya sp.]